MNSKLDKIIKKQRAVKVEKRQIKREYEYISNCTNQCIKDELSDKTEEEINILLPKIRDICESKWNIEQELKRTTYSYCRRKELGMVGGGQLIIPQEIQEKIDDNIRQKIRKLKI